MKRKTIAAVTVVSLFLGATVAGCGDKVCRPNGVRVDPIKPSRYWVCNNDGTKEAPYEPPKPTLK